MPRLRLLLVSVVVVVTAIACDPPPAEGEGEEGEGEGEEGEGEPVCSSPDDDDDLDDVPCADDCDDDDGNVGDRDSDNDCDGVDVQVDCDDDDPAAGSSEEDDDCDEVQNNLDCDPFDPNIGDAENDVDCDGVQTDADCDDLDPFSTARADDADCDGELTADDCDDNDPLSTDVFEDNDCDDVVNFDDCDAQDPLIGSNVNDNDCDGVISDDDCSDFAPELGDRAEDTDCDSFVLDVERACGTDPADPFSRPSDLDVDGECDVLDDDDDGDGALDNDDCVPTDATIGPAATEVPNDGIDNDCDGDFGADLILDRTRATGGGVVGFATTGTRHFIARGSVIDVFDGALASPTLTDRVHLDGAVNSIAVVGDFLIARENRSGTTTMLTFETDSLAFVSRSVEFFVGADVANVGGALFDPNCSTLLDVDEAGTVSFTPLPFFSFVQVCTRAGGKLVALGEAGIVTLDDDGAVSAPLVLPVSPQRLIPDGDVVYAVSQDGVSAIGVAGANPVLLDHLTGDVPNQIAGNDGVVRGDRLYMGNAGGSDVIDISDPSDLRLVAEDEDSVSFMYADDEVIVTFPDFRTNAISLVTVTGDDVEPPQRVAALESHPVAALLSDGTRAFFFGELAFASSLQVRDLSQAANFGGSVVGDPRAAFDGLAQPSAIDTANNRTVANVLGSTSFVVELDGDDEPNVITLPDSSFGFDDGGAVVGDDVVTIRDDFGGFFVDRWSLAGGVATKTATIVTQEPISSVTLIDGVLIAAIDGEIRAFPDADATTLGASVLLPSEGLIRLVAARGNELYFASDVFFGVRVVNDLAAPGPVTGDDLCAFPLGITLDGDRAIVTAFDCVSFYDLAGGGPNLVDERAVPGFIDGAAVPVAAGVTGLIVDGTAQFFIDSRE